MRSFTEIVEPANKPTGTMPLILQVAASAKVLGFGPELPAMLAPVAAVTEFASFAHETLLPPTTPKAKMTVLKSLAHSSHHWTNENKQTMHSLT